MDNEVPRCKDCVRKASAKVHRKYPSKDRTPFWVCGYHLRSYMTSEFARKMIEKPKLRTRILGYAPPEPLVGYAPVEEETV